MRTGFDSLPPDVLEWLETHGPLVESYSQIRMSRTYSIPGHEGLEIDDRSVYALGPDAIPRMVSAWLIGLATTPLDQVELAR